jgi:DNA polymerase I-like protein with 3'-5' exonuclease and polymerase domains/uracil-DNA glycosylase
MKVKPEGCKLCPLLNAPGPVWKSGSANPVLLIQGEAPWKTEVEMNKPFSGPTGRFFRNSILSAAGVNHEQVLFDNTLRCLYSRGKAKYPVGKIRKGAEAACGVYNEWGSFPNIPLLLAGGKAISRYMESENVGQWHGHIEYRDRRILGCTYHPTAVLLEPNFYPLVVQEIRNLMEAAANPGLLTTPLIHKGWLLQQDKPMTFDLEWNNAGTITIVGVSYNGREGYSTFDTGYLEWIRDRLTRPDAHLNPLSGHNISKADLPMLGFTSEQIRDLAEHRAFEDTQLKAHLVHAHFAELGLFGLSDMVKYYFPTGEWKHLKSDMLEYNGWDAAYNWKLNEALDRDLKYTRQEHLLVWQQKLAALSVAMKQRGIAIDAVGLQAYVRAVERSRGEIAASLPFNPRSSAQIKKWAAENFNLSLPNTTFLTLKKHEGKWEEFDRLLKYRENSKELATWFPVEEDDAGELVVTEQMIFPNFNITGTDVDRWSSSGPNVQNIPGGGVRILPGGKTKMMPNLRRFLIPRDKDLQLVSLDYSQLEDYTIAYESQDKQLLEDLVNAATGKGPDLHCIMGATFMSKIKGVSVRPEDIEKKSPERFRGKQTNHQAKYLISAWFLSQQIYGDATHVHVRECEMLLNAYFERYKGVRALHERVAQQIAQGDIAFRNAWGRFRRIYAHNDYKKAARPNAVYNKTIMEYHETVKRAVHFLGCSPGARLTNHAAVEIWSQLKLVPISIEHDSVVLEIPLGAAGERLIKDAREIMQLPCPQLGGISVPVGVAVGINYGELEER